MAQSKGRQENLLTAAAESAQHAFCAFSKDAVGVCVLGTDGKLYRGCTFDSAGYPCSLCAAHVAVAQAATQGRTLVAECAVVELASEGKYEKGAFPLKGCCLEWLWHYSHPSEVYIHRLVLRGTCNNLNNSKAETHKLSELLPMGRRLPAPFPPRCPPLSFTQVETEEGQEADDSTKELVKAAAKAAQGSCCWNSGVYVGCAILTEDGIVTGANAETTALGIGCCAEANAIGYAAALGRKKFLKAAIIISSIPNEPCHPCGRCLQLLMQAQERTCAATAASVASSAPHLVLLMPYQIDGTKGSWRVKARAVNDMGADDRFML